MPSYTFQSYSLIISVLWFLLDLVILVISTAEDQSPALINALVQLQSCSLWSVRGFCRWYLLRIKNLKKKIPAIDLEDDSQATKEMATNLWNLGHFSVPDEKWNLHKLHFILGSFLCFPEYFADSHFWQSAIKAQVQWNPAWLPTSSW